MSRSFSKWFVSPTIALAFGFASTLGACSDDTANDAPSVDVPAPDATVPDATVSDATVPDARTPDATTPDASDASDSGSPDATPGNDPPTLSSVPDQQTGADTATAAVPFTVGDTETAAADLVVTAISSNTALVPNDPTHLVLGGTGADRTLTVVPADRASGTTSITLEVNDGVSSASTTFTVTVTAVGSLYWMTTAGSLWRVDGNGKHAIELVTGISGVSPVTTDPITRSVFYSRDSAIVRADAEGANPVDVVANGGYPSGLAVDATNRKLYWSDFNGKRVMRAELDGSNPVQIVGALDSPSAVAVDVPHGKVYVITYNQTKLVRFDFDGTNQQTLASDLGGQGTGLAIDSAGSKLYFSTRGSALFVGNLDGTTISPLITGQTTVHGIAIDAASGRVFWADWLGTAIRTANLADVSDIETLNAGSTRNLGLAWMPAP